MSQVVLSGDFEIPFGRLASTPFQLLDEQYAFNFYDVENGNIALGRAPGGIPNAPHSGARSLKSLSDDRYVNVACFWPQKCNSKLPHPAHLIWRDLAGHSSNEDASGTKVASISTNANNPPQSYSEYGFDDSSYQRLVDEFSCVLSSTDENSFEVMDGPNKFSSCGSQVNQRNATSPTSAGVSFPPREVLEVSIGLYFRRFHALYPIIHEPTFRVPNISTSLLFTICLIGLCYLGDAGAKRFVHLVAPGTMTKIIREIASISRRSSDSSTIIAFLSSSALFMCLATILSEFANDADIRDLYIETLTIAQRLGLFTEDGDNTLKRLDDEVGNDINDEDLWRIWARVESAKRLIVGLIMCDAYYAHALDIYPVIRSEFMSYYLPSNRDIFEAANSTRWKTLQSAKPSLSTPLLLIRSGRAVILSSLSPFAMHALLATIWIRTSEVKQQRLASRRSKEELSLVSPCHFEADDCAIKDVGMMLLDFYATLSSAPITANPNILAAWNNLCMSLTADHRLFEIAVGRAGPRQARAAQEQIVIWSRTSGARRASLHAAQTFAIMSKRTTSDGTTFHSEIALFASALVLGLFISTSPVCAEQVDHLGQTQDDEPFELLDNVDWDAVGSEGFPFALAQQHTFPTEKDHAGIECAARDFIRNGKQISFGGKIYPGGFDAAQRIFLEYVGLLEGVGRWNVRRYCHILRLVSDLNLDATLAAGD